MSIIWRTRWDGSKLSPIVSPHCSRIRRHIRGRRGDVVPARPLVVAEEHRAVLERDLHARGPARSATMSGQTRRASSQFWSWFFAPSPPMNVFTSGTPIFSAAVDDVLEVADDLLAVGRVGVERVGVEAEAGDREALGRDLVDDLASPGRRTGWRRRCGWCRRSGGSGRSRAASRRSRGPRSRSRRPSRRPP